MNFATLLTQARLRLSHPERGGTATDPDWTERRQIPLSLPTLDFLRSWSRRLRKEDVSAGPMQIAALLIEEAVREEMEALDIDRNRAVSTAAPEGGQNQ